VSPFTAVNPNDVTAGRALNTDQAASRICNGQKKPAVIQRVNLMRGTTYIRFCALSELSFNSIGLFVMSWSSDFPLVVMHTISILLFHFLCMLKGNLLHLNKEEPIAVH
jgi:hypothetical protein